MGVMVKQKHVKGPRTGAAILDFFFFNIITFVLSFLIILNTSLFYYEYGNDYNDTRLTIFLIFLVYSLVSLFYYSIIPYLLKGKTLGKVMTGVKVISDNFEEASFKQFILRNIVLIECIISFGIIFMVMGQNSNIIMLLLLVVFLIFIINIVTFFMIILTEDERALHDFWAKTIVVDQNFDFNHLNHVNSLERKEMTWAEFEDDDTYLDDSDEDDIEILNQ